jgi:hypothetical protein
VVLATRHPVSSCQMTVSGVKSSAADKFHEKIVGWFRALRRAAHECSNPRAENTRANLLLIAIPSLTGSDASDEDAMAMRSTAAPQEMNFAGIV